MKTTAGIESVTLSTMTRYDRLPFMMIPTTGDPQAADLPALLTRQASGMVRPVAFELPNLPKPALPRVARAATAAGVRSG